jgi:hypothetical protein
MHCTTGEYGSGSPHIEPDEVRSELARIGAELVRSYAR